MSYGPFFDELNTGETITPLPSLTLSAADNTFYRAITGDQHLLTADCGLYNEVSGSSGSLALRAALLRHRFVARVRCAFRRAEPI